YVAALVAADINGRPSAKVNASFSRLGEAPKIEISSISSGKGAMDPVATGSLVVVGPSTSLAGKLSAPNGLATAEYSIDGGAWTKAVLGAKPEADGSITVSVALPETLGFGRFLVRARVTDALGASGQWQASFYRVAPVPTVEIVDKEGVYLSDARVGDGGVMVLSPGESLDVLFNGRPIESVSLVPAVPFMSTSFEGSVVRVTANAEGLAPASVIRVKTVDGDSYDSTPVLFRSDAEDPAITVSAPAAGVWLKDTLILDAQSTDANGLADAGWSLDGGESWTAFTASATGVAPLAMKLSIPVSREDGHGELLLRATDRAGKQSVSSIPFYKDSIAPELVVASPASADLVNGFIYIGLEAKDAGDLAKAEFSPDGTAWEVMSFVPRGAEPSWPTAKDASIPDYAGRWSFGRLVDLAALTKGPAQMAYRLTDKAGNMLSYRPLAPEAPAFAVDIEADKPRVQIQIPVENEVMRANFMVSGMAFDDDGIKEIHYRVDGGAWQTVDGANSFSVPFTLLETADNEHMFEAYALDLNGVQGDTMQHRFRVSREEPVGKLIAPDVSITNKGIIQLKGQASDANGIKDVWISFDNGNTYNKAVGTTDWTYSLDTRILADGVHSVYLKLVDGYDTPGFAAGLISIDNTAPLLEITG
ncbi:MAG TPA: Ig-like domain-containing protein, partial [Spirochaetales bacterium]|nr:Ig-like domain-containing protein [Spirochaetales bacterium]